MIRITKQPASFSLAGNPVLFEIETDSADPVDVLVEVNGSSVNLIAYPYPKNLSYTADIEISDILKAHFDQDTSVPDDNIIVSALADFVLDYSVTIGTSKVELHTINGGISDQLALVLDEYGMDAFSYRLESTDRSFLFTTRTNSPNIILKESEVFPFIFLHPGQSISFKTANNRVITTPSMTKGTACLMDINTLRKTFYDLYKEVPTYFQILVENSYTFDITVTPNRISEDFHLLRFRNSLGGFEQMEITGRPYFTPEISDDYSWKKLNSRRTFETRKERNEISHKLTVETGYKTGDELFFLMDILSSDQVYLVSRDESIRRCMVKASSDIKIPFPVITPQSIALEISLLVSEKFYSPDVDFSAPGAWLLQTGFWNDFARWKDNKYWND
ncbi:hypothetical protein E2605_11925 [Dysgonomonas capnocytophagoides]|uniref:Uncharacterized protein n=1 Tax=Dysgonomonas capnocytophagoides TaxID=45254 RepID=A0A4Y8L0K0_9BACT|nr:hypothetical protein [Dysgonomonas capnocytophagoides]TFD95548.1 hypothetical protein E2605_11925 [Dysgonomonas capnocytophagoides]